MSITKQAPMLIGLSTPNLTSAIIELVYNADIKEYDASSVKYLATWAGFCSVPDDLAATTTK